MSDEPVLGDIDPEDAWDDGDPIDDKIVILDRVLAQLRQRSDDRHEARRANALRLLGKLQQVRSDDPRLAELRERLEAL
jgi:hypothetical protein